MANIFESSRPGMTGPAQDIVPVTPSDSTDLADVALALYVEVGGTLSIITVRGETRTVIVADYTILPVGTRRVRATGTTATGIHALVIS